MIHHLSPREMPLLRANKGIRSDRDSIVKSHCNAGRIVGVASVHAGSRCLKCLKPINNSSIVFPNTDYRSICSQMRLHGESDVALRQNGRLRAARFFRKRKVAATSTDGHL